MNSTPSTTTEQIEIDLLLEGIFQRWGYDFRNYAPSSLGRRLKHRLGQADMVHFSEMLPRVLHDQDFFNLLLRDLSVTVTDMFRDPEFFATLRREVFPVLKTYPFIKIWHAGCATGEEVYSMAIMLKEAGLYDRAQIYATDFNNHSLQIAREGVYPIEGIRDYTKNYIAAGGKASLSDYYHARYGSAKMHSSLRKNMTFAYHNLVTDGAFGEMNLIICRNVMIYFDKTLQNKVFSLFRDSLAHRGFLCLGSKETIDYSLVSDSFETTCANARVFQALSQVAPLVAGGMTI